MGGRVFYISPAVGYTAGLNFYHIYGQSLAEGSVGGTILTTSQEYDNIKFPKAASSPSAYEPAFAVGTNTETPMYGAVGKINALIEADGIDPITDNYQLLTCNNGYGSYSILALQKGSVEFNRVISQVSAAKAIADSEGRSFRFKGTMWLQGEADNSMSIDDYATTMRTLANDISDMGRSAAGQRESAIFVTYQTTTNPLPNVPLAQLMATKQSAIIFMAAPCYFLDFAPDGIHLTAESAKFIGGYFGLVYKNVLIDGGMWEPVWPLSNVQSGNDVTITFNVPVGPLVLDTTLLPIQPNYGFAAFQANDASVAITSVSIVDNTKVKITTANVLQPGGYITYALSPQADPPRSNGGCGNLRDSQGTVHSYLGKPMHNWCVLFKEVVKAQLSVLNFDDDQYDDVLRIESEGVTVTEDADSFNVDLNGDGVADVLFKKKKLPKK